MVLSCACACIYIVLVLIIRENNPPPSIADSERDALVAKAKAITPVTRSKPEPVQVGESSVRREAGCSSPQVNIVGSRVHEGSTKIFGKHTIEEGDLKTFLNWLQSVDGQERSPSQAQQIAVDVSKYLFLADSSKVDLTMAYNVDKANEFLDALKKQGLRAVGILGKILHLQNLLSFLETAIEDDGVALAQTMPADALSKISRMRLKLKSWHAHFAKLKSQVCA